MPVRENHTRVGITLSNQMVSAIDVLAEREGISRARYIADALAIALHEAGISTPEYELSLPPMLSKAEIAAIAHEVIATNGIPFERLWLFGSYARGDANAHSDVDLAFELADGAKWERLKWARLLSKSLHHDVDLLARPKRSDRVFEDFERDKECIYEREG